MTERARVWRAPGMLDLAVLSVFGFSGYTALLATAPLWAVNGGATAAGSGLVNGVLLAATVLAQLAVPRALASWGTGRVLVAGLLLLGVPAPAYLPSDGLGWVLGLSAVRGLGFGILTVVGSAVAAHLVPASQRGALLASIFLPRRPRRDGRVLPPHRRRSCDRPLSPADHPSLGVGTGSSHESH